MAVVRHAVGTFRSDDNRPALLDDPRSGADPFDRLSRSFGVARVISVNKIQILLSALIHSASGRDWMGCRKALITAFLSSGNPGINLGSITLAFDGK